MGKAGKILLIIEIFLLVPLASYLSLIAAVAGAKLAGHEGGDWGWGFMLAAIVGPIGGGLLAIGAPIFLYLRRKLTHLSLLVSTALVVIIVFTISLIFHWVLQFFL